MQILGKRSKVLLMAVAIIMLIAVGVTFAMWDMSAVKATNGDLSEYANAKVGDIVEFGRYYQTGNKASDAIDAEYEKTPIEWIVVDKDERTGQLTLMSKYILAAGSYFGNWYFNTNDTTIDGGNYYNTSGKANSEVGGNPYNQAYIESTARAFLNNLERRDLGGDSYVSKEFKTSAKISEGKLYSSVGFSNKKYYISNDEYQRPITNEEYRERPATRGYYDEAFSDEEKAMIVPKAIAGYTGFRWPTYGTNEPYEKTYVDGVIDKIWLPSTTELNIMDINDDYTTPSDETGATVFEYFKNYTKYKNPVTDTVNTTLANALKTERTAFVANNSKAMNYSIPVYKYQSIDINTEISTTRNSTDYYWTRSQASSNCTSIRGISSLGSFGIYGTNNSNIGIRPCVILKY